AAPTRPIENTVSSTHVAASTATAAAISNDPDAIAAVAGVYTYQIPASGTHHIRLNSNGTYATLFGSGTFTATLEQIAFVDTLPASGTLCNSDPGTYLWSLDNNQFTLVPIK